MRNAALLLLACAALWGMQSTTPNYTRLLAPIESRGDAGSFVSGRSLAVRVDGIELARALRGQCLEGPRTFETGGVWAIVHATATSVQRPEMLVASAIESADGTRYLRSERADMCADLLSEQTLQPGVPTSGDLIFELPPTALADADLLAGAAMLGLVPLDSQLRIHLDGDAAAVQDIYELPKR